MINLVGCKINVNNPRPEINHDTLSVSIFTLKAILVFPHLLFLLGSRPILKVIGVFKTTMYERLLKSAGVLHYRVSQYLFIYRTSIDVPNSILDTEWFQ